ncbi:MAG: alpha/beta hydrolase [Magnetovibrio sp.]|nr:alpha/beta hydrolase [Magnetovibrio sp.]|tara:strand:- start:1084 stop:1932 length:849 start_codon:yes stop_codon:yes gene_type:complete
MDNKTTPQIGSHNSTVTLFSEIIFPEPDQLGYVDFDDHQLEFIKFHRRNTGTTTLVLLHEGLGSVDMWHKFPAYLASATDAEVIAYSRRGYGRSSPRNASYSVNYMHLEARETLPRLLEKLDVAEPVLIGHSDGASIALIHAADQPSKVRGVAVLAPHIMVEDLSIREIGRTREEFYTSDLKKKLARYHDDPVSTFWGWNNIWLNPNFLAWDIRGLLSSIHCPILAIQGENDPYGTMAQINQIKSTAKNKVKLLKLKNCGHSPHREKPEETLCALKSFILGL